MITISEKGSGLASVELKQQNKRIKKVGKLIEKLYVVI